MLPLCNEIIPDLRIQNCNKTLQSKLSSKFQSTGSGNTRLLSHTSSTKDIRELTPSTDVPTLIPCDSVRVGIDYFRFLTKHDHCLTPEKFRLIYQYLFPSSEPIVEKFSEEPQYSIGKGMKKYCTHIASLHGCNLYYTELDHGNIEFVVDLSGEYLSRFALSELLEINSFFRQFESVKCSRFDISIDIPRAYQLDVLDLRVAYSNGDFYGFKKANITSKLDGTEATIYLGSRESSQYIRIYDMVKKHCMDAQRYEIEYKRKLADFYSHYLYQLFPNRGVYAVSQSERTGQDWRNHLESTEQYELRISRELAGFALGAVGFVDRSYKDSHTKIDELPKLPFWDRFLSEINQGIAIKPVRIPIVPKSLQKSLDWLTRQVSKLLLVLKKGMGFKNFKVFLDALLLHSEDKITKKDRAIIDFLKQQYAAS